MLQGIAGFDLCGGGAVKQHGLRSRAGGVFQILQRGGAGCAHRRANAAASLGDLLVALALQAHLEFRCAVAGPNQVSVRIDKTGHDHPPGSVEALLVRIGLQQLRAGAGRLDDSSANQHSPVEDDSQPAEVASTLRTTSQGEQLR